MKLVLVNHRIYNNVGYILRSPCTLGTLFTSTFSDQRTFCTLILHVCDALKTLHSIGSIHGDISPSNIFVHNDSYILNDFGVSRACINSLSVTIAIRVTSLIACYVFNYGYPSLISRRSRRMTQLVYLKILL